MCIYGYRENRTTWLVFRQLGVARRRGPQHAGVALQLAGIDVREYLLQVRGGGRHREEAVDDVRGAVALHGDRLSPHMACKKHIVSIQV